MPNADISGLKSYKKMYSANALRSKIFCTNSRKFNNLLKKKVFVKNADNHCIISTLLSFNKAR